MKKLFFILRYAGLVIVFILPAVIGSYAILFLTDNYAPDVEPAWP